MEDVRVVVATIALGWESINWIVYTKVAWELLSKTGRAGRDGGEGHCLAVLYKDVEKLEKICQ
jgi:ATP-dependent DNA helicase RecQ